MRENFAHVGSIDPMPLLAKLQAKAELWDADTWRQYYPGSPHAQASAIILRWQEERTVEAAFREVICIDYPSAQLLMPEAGDVIDKMLDAIGVAEDADIGRVMVTKLPPGGTIAEHVDEGLYADHYERFHICLQGDAGNRYRCGGIEYRPTPGEMFWFNHKLPHSVSNEGAIDRIHMILDVESPEYRCKRGIYFQAERGSDLWHEAQPLLEAHWREVAHYKDIAFAPDADFYLSQERAGSLRCFTARDCGRLIGYVVFFVRRNPHYVGSLQAVQDVLFVLPEYRRGMTGVRLMRLAEERLRAEDVQVIYHHAKLTNNLGALLRRMGYELIDEIYGKRLDRR